MVLTQDEIPNPKSASRTASSNGEHQIPRMSNDQAGEKESAAALWDLKIETYLGFGHWVLGFAAQA